MARTAMASENASLSLRRENKRRLHPSRRKLFPERGKRDGPSRRFSSKLLRHGFFFMKGSFRLISPRRPGTSPRSSRRCTYAALFHMDAEHGRDAGGREVRPERTASSCFFRFRSAGRHRTAPSCSCHKISPEYSGLVRERFEFGNIGRYGTAKLACGAFPCYGEKVRRIFTQ